jgi:hypothetical protein
MKLIRLAKKSIFYLYLQPAFKYIPYILILFLLFYTQSFSQIFLPDTTDTFFLAQNKMTSVSGTAWLPNSSPLTGYTLQQKSWSFLFRGNVFARYTGQDITRSGNRGAAKFDAPNWFSGMVARPISARTTIMLRTGLSLERLTEGAGGYPLLFQTGVTYDNKLLIDRQHPMDLFTELALGINYDIGRDTTFFLYFGLPGEPATGPPIFLQRPSAMNLPDAPVSYRWQDQTHISFGVATAGIIMKNYKLDASIFNGRQPNENRFDIDTPQFDSRSIRLSMNPSDNLALQVSYAFLKSPDPMETDVNYHRTVASVLYNLPLPNKKNLSASLVWGINLPDVNDQQHSILLEANYQTKNSSLFSRLEFVQKPTQNLSPYQYVDSLFLVNAFTIGGTRNLLSSNSLNISAGALATFYLVDKELHPIYGEWPVSLEFFLRFSPPMIKKFIKPLVPYL